MSEEKKDFIERHKMVTRLAMICVIVSFVKLVWFNSSNSTLIEYTSWALVFMFSALLFGDKMLVQIKDIVRAWKGN